MSKDKKPPKGHVSNPYIGNGIKFNQREAQARFTNRMQSAALLVMAAVLLMAVGGLIYYGNQSKFVPYVVEVDRLGAAVGVQPATPIRLKEDVVLKAAVSAFIADARMVTPDATLQRRAIFRVYGLLSMSDPAFQKMNEHLNGDPKLSPFARAEKVAVQTEILSVIPQTKTTWEVDWIETVRQRTGVIQEQYRMRAILSVYFAPDSYTPKEEDLRINPLSIFVRDFSWTRVGD